MKPLLVTLVTAFAVIAPTAARADVSLAPLFTDHMVLQRGVPVPVWGWADPGERVTATLAGQTQTAMPDGSGRWRVSFAPLAVGPALTLSVQGKNTVTVSDAVVGEVWLASGQSNMDYALGWDAKINAAALASADDPLLRCFQVPHISNLEPQTKVPAKWQVASNSSVQGWSAVAYYFARDLREKLKVPVGIIHSSYGGTPAEAWTSPSALAAEPMFAATSAAQIAAMRSFPADAAAFAPALAAWTTQNGAEDRPDPAAQGWEKPDLDETGWHDVDLPVNFTQLGFKGGAVIWYRKTFVLPADATKAFNLNLLGLSGSNTIYFNGTVLAENNPQPAFSTDRRTYLVPAALIHPGASNTIAVRQWALTGADYFWEPIQNLGLPMGTAPLPDNKWKYRIERQFPALSQAAAKALPKYPTSAMQLTPGTLFNAMINPLVPYAMRGVIWYQGENNSQHPVEYRRLLPLLIADWRARWGEGDFPFYIVQLANYGSSPPQPAQSNWALLREAQWLTAVTVPHSGLATAVDIGDPNNIHPKNKRDVGLRLALLALHRTYGQDIEDSGPEFDSMVVEGSTIRLKFSHADGLTSRDGPPKYFTIAGADRQYQWADAKIDGQTIVVSSPAVPAPVSVRYAWADSPTGINVYNAAGLPALPFRTDRNDMDPVVAPVVAIGTLSQTGLLRNGDFTSPPVPDGKNFSPAHPSGWTLDIEGGQPALGVEAWKKTRPPFFFWSDPKGSISQSLPDPIAHAGTTYTLTYRYGGQGAGGSYTLTPAILVDGVVVVSHDLVVDLTKPGIEQKDTLTYTSVAKDAGRHLSVEFNFTKLGTVAIQGALAQVVLSAGSPQ